MLRLSKVIGTEGENVESLSWRKTFLRPGYLAHKGCQLCDRVYQENEKYEEETGEQRVPVVDDLRVAGRMLGGLGMLIVHGAIIYKATEVAIQFYQSLVQQ